MPPSANQPVAQALPPIPAWLRRDPPPTETEAAFLAGAALATLDARARADVQALVPFAGVWRRRLALQAAAASTRIARRNEDAATLRDSFFLRSADADAGPAGKILMAWRALDRSTPLDDDSVLHVAGLLNVNVDDKLRTALRDVQHLAKCQKNTPLAAAEAARIVMAQRADAEVLALWLADAVLAACQKWPLPLPLLASTLIHSALRIDGRRPHPIDASWALSCCAAYARAAVAACDLFAELERNSQKLLMVASRLRAKGAGAVIDRLHNEDAVPPSGRIGPLSDRGLRRLFDRLTELDAVRELTGRSTFRLYGL